jgi:hypothetical protein
MTYPPEPPTGYPGPPPGYPGPPPGYPGAPVYPVPVAQPLADTAPIPIPVQPNYPAPAYQPVPYPYLIAPQSASSGRTRLVVVFVAVALILGAGIGVGATLLVRNPGTPAAVGSPSSTPSPTPSPTPTLFTGDLRSLLVPAPPGSSPYKTPLSADGTLNQDQVAALYGNPARIKTLLDAEEFESAAVVQWRQVDDTLVEIKLYQFAAQQGATSWAATEAHSYVAQATLTDHSPCPGIDDSTYIIDPKPDKDDLVMSVVIAATRNVVMKVFVFQVHMVNEPVTLQLAQDQYAKLI